MIHFTILTPPDRQELWCHHKLCRISYIAVYSDVDTRLLLVSTSSLKSCVGCCFFLDISLKSCVRIHAMKLQYKRAVNNQNYLHYFTVNLIEVVNCLFPVLYCILVCNTDFPVYILLIWPVNLYITLPCLGKIFFHLILT